jgi:hypothetical protein
MVWYKAWVETRWRFIVGLVLLMMVACGHVLEYPAVAKLTASTQPIADAGATGRLLNEAMLAQRTYRGFIWWQWFRQNLTQLGTILAVLLGSGGVLATSRRGTLFTLSLPVSRVRLTGIRAATGLLEFLAIAVIPSLVIPALSPAIGERYSVADVLVHGICVFAAGSVFFSLAFFLSTVFGDLWRPLLIACSVSIALSVWELVHPGLSPGFYAVMRGDRYFNGSGLPWLGLVSSTALSAAIVYAAISNIARQDY